jgi:hypothetical protein
MRIAAVFFTLHCIACGANQAPPAPPAAEPVASAPIAARGYTCPANAYDPLIASQPWPPPATSSAPPATSSSAPRAVMVIKMIETGTSIQGQLAPQRLKFTVRMNFAKMRRCYQDALKRNGSLTGTVATEFLIGTDGRTRWADARSEGTTITDQEMLSCVERVLACLTYPEPETGMVFVRYPITFENHE